MKRFIALVLMLLVFGIMRGNAAEFSTTDCPFNTGGNYQIDCGFVTVPADHANPDGATIQLAVAIVRSPNPNKAPDPVLYLEGGPGGAPVALASSITRHYPFLGIALQNRDVILVDQRGMGLSQPSFYCTPFRSLLDAFTNDYAGLFMERMPECLDDFAEQGLDWRLFTTEQNALDLAMVGEALGYEQVNLQGTSYGTLLGLIILREHPEIVRSAILDSVLIPAASPFESSAADFEASFAQLESYCAADFACNLAYPNLRESFISTYERLEANPESLEIAGQAVPVTGSFFAGRVRHMLASADTAKFVPAFILGFANRDYDVVRAFVEMVYSLDPDELPNQALFMTMVCPQSYSDFEGVDSPFQTGGFSPADSAMCQAWGEVLPFDRTMPVSDVPVLLLSGELDPLTPPQWSALAAEGLSNSTRLLFPNTSHEVLKESCGQRIAINFLENPDTAPDTSCISQISGIGFILHTTVTRFPIQIATALLTVFAVFGMGQMAFYGLRNLRRTTWWSSFRRLGFIPLIALAVLLLLVYNNAKVLPPEIVSLGVVQAMIPLFMALHVASVFNPGDEPSLEIQLAAPRSPMWLLAERVLVVILVYCLIALLGVGMTLWLEPEQNLPVLFLGWLPPALFLSGMGIYVTVRSRVMAMGVLLIGVLWFMFSIFAPFFLPGENFPAPFHLIQPFIWPMHVHASLNDLAPQDFWLNRLFLAAGGIGFMLLSAYSLRDSEELLLGMKARKGSTKKADASHQTALKPKLTHQPVAVRIQPLMQILGIIRYEFIIRWRTMGMKVFIITPIALVLIFTMSMNPQELFLPTTNTDLYSPEYQAFINGKLFGALICTILFVPALYLYPVLVANSFPQDKRLGVEELLNAAPLGFATQSIGRIIGTILAAWAGLGLSVGVIVLIWYFRFGAFFIEPMLDLTLGAALFCAVTTGITMLLGASQNGSRSAVFLSLAFLGATEFFQMIELVRWFFPTRSIFVVTYFQGMADVTGGVIRSHQFSIFNPNLLEVLWANCFSLVLLWLGLWAWKRFRANS